MNAVDDKGKGCLARAQHHVDIVKLLIARGASVSVDEVLVAIEVGSVPFLEALLSCGFDVNMCRVMDPKSKSGHAFGTETIYCDPTLLHLFPLYYAATMLVLPTGRGDGGSEELEVKCSPRPDPVGSRR